ncbi:hypothetical protein [Helicobacter mustelae]|uniref:Uncharacterized protein n=1 Tax=Helicobacter mustelae (strain ATCC 43772 / CCUG 25715 / CIP 103759 / LMG 18044 / NCTC 12198 / R85-136P) TaxID=679897 RepID=D3UI17_HELM1|nr:hypothetical protein [Helicobacter mustelae]CBG40140.1 Putative hypothetical protein [Helicobacter mustelae 12198]SQH71643.1 Uncharacterised protein [Helicobacter mustelae]STP12768.1 Uncharacterised protein [Helicobacter mustelae]
MQGRKIAKIILGIGALICVGLFVFFYIISNKVKKELQAQVNSTISAFNQDGIAQITFDPFVCKGFFSYECKSQRLELSTLWGQKITEVRDIRFGFKNITPKSIDETLHLSTPNFFGDIYEAEDLGGVEVNYEGSESIKDAKIGEILNDWKLSFDLLAASLKLQGKRRNQDPKWANQNIIQIEMASMRNLGAKLLNAGQDLAYQELELQIDSKGLENFAYTFLQKRGMEMSKQEYEEQVRMTAVQLKSTIQEDPQLSSWKDALTQAIDGAAELLLGEAKSLKLKLRSKDGGYVNLKNFTQQYSLDTLRSLSKVFNLSTEVKK